MSFSLARTVAAGARKICSLNKAVVGGQTLATNAGLQGRGLQTLSRSFTRSNWILCKNTSESTIVKDNQVAGWKRTCGCCGLHTQGDQELVNFLDEEIKEEKKSEKKLGSVKGFEISSDGAEVVFTKKSDNEIVTVTLNVNNSVDDESGMEGEQDQQDQSQAAELKMVCRPPFLVEIGKGGQYTLGLQCTFPPAESIDAVQGEEQFGADLIEVQEIALYSGDNWGDKVYSVEGPVMDGNLYDMLLNMLEERGVDADFIDQIVEYSTSYEHRRYVNFLQGLKDFVSSK